MIRLDELITNDEINSIIHNKPYFISLISKI